MMNRLKIHFTNSLILLCPFILTSCIELDQEIIIKDDQQGLFKIKAVLPLDVVTTLKRYDPPTQESVISRFLDPGFGKNCFSEEQGLTLYKYRVFERSRKVYIQIEGKINNLALAFKSKSLGAFQYAPQEDGTFLLKMNFDELLLNGKKHSENIDFQHKKSLFEGLKLSLKITVPKKIIGTSAPIWKKKVATWIFDLEKDDQFLTQLPKVYVLYK